MAKDLAGSYLMPTPVAACPKIVEAKKVPEKIEPFVGGKIREVSAYNSLPEQTDSSPCEGAYGNVCEPYKNGLCVVASNAFKGHSILLIENVGQCEVLDTMNERYPNRVDIFMGNDLGRAVDFGIQKLRVLQLN